jgi:hypothetical protein
MKPDALAAHDHCKTHAVGPTTLIYNDEMLWMRICGSGVLDVDDPWPCTGHQSEARGRGMLNSIPGWTRGTSR